MRGTLPTAGGVEIVVGIIPAYAGNTRLPGSCSRGVRDHPRVCGEHGEIDVCMAGNMGSSPRMRGTRRLHRLLCRRPGIIPAYAGNTPIASSPVPPTWDHPRVCGEHISSSTFASSTLGSSPHMRGTHFSGSLLIAWLGIIPAYAGNTSPPRQSPSEPRDHPRICGERRR